MDERLDGLMKEISKGEELLFHTKEEELLFHTKDEELLLHAMDQRFLFHTTEKALGRKISNALEEADSGKEEIRKQIQRQVRQNRKEIIRMGIFLHTYLVTGPGGSRGEAAQASDRPGRKPQRSCTSR